MKKASYDHKPNTFDLVGDGSTIYHFSIEEITIEKHTQWLCYEVVIFGAVSSDKLTALVMELMYGNGVEAKFINDYNAANLNILESEYIDKYKAFLIERNMLKMEISTDCDNLKI